MSSRNSAAVVCVFEMIYGEPAHTQQQEVTRPHTWPIPSVARIKGSHVLIEKVIMTQRQAGVVEMSVSPILGFSASVGARFFRERFTTVERRHIFDECTIDNDTCLEGVAEILC